MKIMKYIGVFIITSLPSFSFAAVGPGHVSGDITNITSVNAGILVRIGANEVPENCTSGKAWMLISEEKKSMISLTITAWTLGKTVTVYTTATTNGYCLVHQVDPVG